MAASISFQATAVDGTTTSVSYTFPLTVASASGQERLIALGFVTTFPGTGLVISSVTVDGQTAAVVAGSDANGISTTNIDCAKIVFYRVSGTAGTTINVVVSFSAGTSFGGMCALWSLNDADTLLAAVTSITDDPSLNINAITSGVVAAAGYGYEGTVPPTATWVGLNEDFDAVRVFSTHEFTGASLNSGATSTPLTVGITYTAFDALQSFAASAVSFNPNATGTTNIVAFSTVGVDSIGRSRR